MSWIYLDGKTLQHEGCVCVSGGGGGGGGGGRHSNMKGVCV